MSDATAITTVAEFYQQISVDGSEDDALIQGLIDRETEMFTKYCEIESFFIGTYIEQHDGNATHNLFVKNYPVNSIAEIAVDSDWLFATESVIDTSDYKIVDDRYVAYKSLFSSGLQNIRITYTAGYSVIPVDIVAVMLQEIVKNYARRKEPDVVIKTLTDGSTHFTPSGLMPSTKQVLDKYKKMRAN